MLSMASAASSSSSFRDQLEPRLISDRLQAVTHIPSTRRLTQAVECPAPEYDPPAPPAVRKVRQRSEWRNCGRVYPTNELVQRLRRKNAPITSESWAKAREIAASNSPRGPVLAHQVVIAKSEAELETSLTGLMQDPEYWTRRLTQFAYHGIREEDVNHWIWILEASDTDTKVERLVSTRRFKPIFVLMAILRSDEYMVKGATLVKLYDYIANTYIAAGPQARTAMKELLDAKMHGKTLDSFTNMTPHHFKLVITRLVGHCLRTFPSSLPMVARLVVAYLGGLGDWKPKRKGQLPAYAVHCSVFNNALTNFRRIPPSSSLANMPHNWKAIKIMLGYSAGLDKPYVISQDAYRAIRMVLLGLKKSRDERTTASRYAQSWPPYIKQLDGTDEAKPQEAYYSGVVKAGILKQSEGYPHDVVDYAIDRLGGALPGQSVAIQTRGPPLGLIKNQNTAAKLFTYWAAKVRATRNAYEAWQIFQQPPMAGLKPDFQVYAEMFEKLFAIDVEEDSSSLPGDGKENHLPYLANLTELESERIRPCSPDELYQQMIATGQRPVQHLLSVLVSNAPTVRKAHMYLNDSPLDKNAVQNMTRDRNPERYHLAKIPLPIFEAYLTFLCSQQGRKRWNDSEKSEGLHPAAVARYGHIHRAIRLVGMSLSTRRKRVPSPWHVVMQALANQHVVLNPTASWAEDDVAGLKTMMGLYYACGKIHGPHPIPFDCLCRCILKVLRDKIPALLAQQADRGAVLENTKMNRLIIQARYLTNLAFDTVTSAFAELRKPVDQPSDERLAASAPDALPPLYHELSASHIRTYLEVLAKFGAVDEAVRVVEWVLATSGDPDRTDTGGKVFAKAADRGHKQWAMMSEAFVCFRAMVDGSRNLDSADKQRIQARFAEIEARGGPWRWPSGEDVESYALWRKEQEVWRDQKADQTVPP